MGLFESKILEGDFAEPEWLEKESYGGLRVWHLGFFGFSGFVCVGLWQFFRSLFLFNLIALHIF